MIDFFYNLDVSIFYFINHTLSNPIFDKFFVYITDIKSWYLVYVIALVASWKKGGRVGKIAAVTVLFLIAVSDQTSSNLLKNFFQRIRPCNALPEVNILTYCSGSFSFPSSHAVNNFAVAIFFAKIFPNMKKILLATASLIALSRPYVGVHYPSDILAGAIIGSAIGYLFSILVFEIDKLMGKKIIKNNE